MDQSRPTPTSVPQVKAATFEDLRASLRAGWDDFKAHPKFGVFFSAVYALGGLVLMAAIMRIAMPWLAYPLVIGFALIGPFIATGLYEVSRRRELGQPLEWDSVLGVVWQQHRRELGWMAFVMLFIFWVWMYQVRTLVAVFFGFSGFSTLDAFLTEVFTTSNGWTFLMVGHVVGAAISMVLFSLTVVSIPLLLDRDVDFITAMLTSIRAVSASPLVMLAWGVFVVLAVVLSAFTAFVALLLVLPVLGHATWHLYRRLVLPDAA